MRRKIFLLIKFIFNALIFSVGSLALICWPVHEIWLSHQSLYWPKTAGRVALSCISMKGRNPMPCVTYKYKVKDVTYESGALYFGFNGNLSAQDDAYEVVRQFPVGKNLSVAYNPQSPDVSCLQPGRLHWATYLLIAFGFGGIWAGNFILRDDWKRLRRKISLGNLRYLKIQ